MEIFCQKADVLKIKQHSNVTNNKQRYRTIGCTVADLFHRLLQIVAFNESGGGCYFDFNGN